MRGRTPAMEFLGVYKFYGGALAQFRGILTFGKEGYYG